MVVISTARRIKSLEFLSTPWSRDVRIFMIALDMPLVEYEEDIMSLKSSVNSGVSRRIRVPWASKVGMGPMSSSILENLEFFRVLSRYQSTLFVRADRVFLLVFGFLYNSEINSGDWSSSGE